MGHNEGGGPKETDQERGECLGLVYGRFTQTGTAYYSEACICISRNNVGESSWQEITLIPCHHPKTELLQNILRVERNGGRRESSSVVLQQFKKRAI